MLHGNPVVSFVLATHNRCDVLQDTITAIAGCGLPRSAYEVIIVDNASRDATVALSTPRVDRLVKLKKNVGSCAKAFGVDHAVGRYVVFLDDDSFPRSGSIERMVARFDADDRLAAAGFTIHLRDGGQECSALPGVFVGCGVGLRAEALREVGGLDPTFFMQAEEYDLCFRLANAGWTVDVFDDLHVDHLKTSRARRCGRTTYYDVRNNLRVAARHLPSPYHEIYSRDWTQRYRWLAADQGHEGAFRCGVRAGRRRADEERLEYTANRLAPLALERFFQWNRVREDMARLAASGTRQLVLADLGKNVYAFFQGSREAGMDVLAIGDDRFGGPGRSYRGIPVRPLEKALARGGDAVVVSNMSAVQAAGTARRVRALTSRPIHDWFGHDESGATEEISSVDSYRPTDEQVKRPATQTRRSSTKAHWRAGRSLPCLE